jgi:glycosyltransferase involved in cell wall biosynthesis
MSRPSVSLVIPALNEAENLPHVLPRIPDLVDEVILVDGRSTDGTIAIAKALRPDIRIVEERTPGKGAALRAGFAAASGEIIVMLDADGSTDPQEIPGFVEALVAGADFAKGSRFLSGGGTSDMPFYRRLGNRSFLLLIRMLFRRKFSDLCYGYNAFWSRVLPVLRLDGDGFEIETMMNVRALRAGLKVVEVPSFEARRLYGRSRLRTIPDGIRVLRTIFIEWRSRAGSRVSAVLIEPGGLVGVMADDAAAGSTAPLDQGSVVDVLTGDGGPVLAVRVEATDDHDVSGDHTGGDLGALAAAAQFGSAQPNAERPGS